MIRRPLSVATYNLHGCVGVDRRYAPARVAEVLRELDCDILGLQEVDDRRPPYDGLPQLAYLSRALGHAAIAGPAIFSHRGDYGNALLTRLPVAAVRRIDLSHRGREPRGAIDVDLISPDGPLRVVVTHLGLDPRERRRQVGMLADALSHAPHAAEPTLLLGDLNEWLPLGWGLGRLGRRFAASYAGRSWPSRVPVLPLDRVFAHPLPLEADARVHATALARRASDHLPLRVSLRWPAPSRAPKAGVL